MQPSNQMQPNEASSFILTNDLLLKYPNSFMSHDLLGNLRAISFNAIRVIFNKVQEKLAQGESFPMTATLKFSNSIGMPVEVNEAQPIGHENSPCFVFSVNESEFAFGFYSGNFTVQCAYNSTENGELITDCVRYDFPYKDVDSFLKAEYLAPNKIRVGRLGEGKSQVIYEQKPQIQDLNQAPNPLEKSTNIATYKSKAPPSLDIYKGKSTENIFEIFEILPNKKTNRSKEPVVFEIVKSPNLSVKSMSEPEPSSVLTINSSNSQSSKHSRSPSISPTYNTLGGR